MTLRQQTLSCSCNVTIAQLAERKITSFVYYCRVASSRLVQGFLFPLDNSLLNINYHRSFWSVGH